jgi:anti-sigma factor RsiW
MIERRLEDHLTDFYRCQELSPQKLLELRALGENRRISRKKATVHAPLLWSRPRVLLHRRVAAAAFLLLLGAFYLGRIFRPASLGVLTADALARSIGSEIAMNHRKQLNLEFSAGDYATLQAQMSKLDFALAPPSNPAASSLHVVGARYCSIQGQLAAQIRARDPAGTVYTLYETKLTDKLRTVAGEVKAEGVRIRLWSEKGLFYGLAVNESQSN